MGDHVIQALLLSKLDDLDQALVLLQDAQAQQLEVKRAFPKAYDERFHAAGIATHIQGIYTQIEGVLKQTIETTDGRLPKSETWHQDLIRLAGMTVPSVRGPLLSSEGVRSLKAVLAFRHKVRANYAGELDPAKVFEQIANTVSAAQETADGIRSFFAPEPEVPPPERDA